MKKEVLNIILAGTGGQGVITLSNLVRQLAVENGLLCEGASFKGGAQRMGTVYTELRLVKKTAKTKLISSQVPMGEVDILMGLEPWETLRFANRCNTTTKVIANTKIEKLYIDRFDKKQNENPVQQIENTFAKSILKNYTEIALQQSGNAKATNLFLLMDAIENNYLPFNIEQLEKLIERNENER